MAPHVGADLSLQSAAFTTLLLASIVLLVIILIIRGIARGFRGVGFTRGEVLSILLLAPLLSFVNLPLEEHGNVILAINLGGAVIPIIVSLRLFLTGRAPPFRTLLATVFVTLVAYPRAQLVTGEGVVVDWIVPVLAAVAISLLLSLFRMGRAAPMSYVSGTIGILIGVDIVRIPQILQSNPAQLEVASIGGAGALDAVFLVGFVAVLLSLFTGGLVGAKR
ncbi:MAG: DUF1614 domain-containing protein [Thermoplasmatota archaeon]